MDPQVAAQGLERLVSAVGEEQEQSLRRLGADAEPGRGAGCAEKGRHFVAVPARPAVIERALEVLVIVGDAAHGGAEQWGKYATPRMNIPGGEGTFDIHFYQNEVTGELYYYDYKSKLGGGNRR